MNIIIDYFTTDKTLKEKTSFLEKNIIFNRSLDMLDIRNDKALRNKLKHDMALELANHMMKDKLLEFTEFYDNISQIYKISARCYLAPDDQVKLLRVNKVI